MKHAIALAASALAAGLASANEWKAITSGWSYAPGTIQEETVTPKQGKAYKDLSVWMKSTGAPLTVQVSAVCDERRYRIVRLMDGGNVVDGYSRLDYPPGHALFPLIEAVDRVCKERRRWWRF